MHYDLAAPPLPPRRSTLSSLSDVPMAIGLSSTSTLSQLNAALTEQTDSPSNPQRMEHSNSVSSLFSNRESVRQPSFSSSMMRIDSTVQVRDVPPVLPPKLPSRTSLMSIGDSEIPPRLPPRPSRSTRQIERLDHDCYCYYCYYYLFPIMLMLCFNYYCLLHRLADAVVRRSS